MPVMSLLQEFKKCYLFDNIPPDKLDVLMAKTQARAVEKNEIIVHEGDTPDFLYIVAKGEFDVIKIDHETGHRHLLTTLAQDDTIGEISLIDSMPRSAIVKAKTNGLLYALPIPELEQFSKDYPDYYLTLFKNIAKIITTNLRYTNETVAASLTAQLQHAEMRVKMGNFLVSIISLLCIYAFLLSFAIELVNRHDTDLYASAIVLIAILIPTLIVIKHDKYQLKENGLNLNHWQHNLKESVLFTLYLLPFTVLIKWIAINTLPAFADEPLFSGIFVTQRPNAWMLFSLYMLSCPVQEFIARGILQSSMEKFFLKKSPWLAIFSSNLIYSTLHLYLSIFYAIATFVPGLFFGWLYARQKSLLGPTVAHMMVGGWCIYILGVHRLLELFSS
jgi:CRP-like cAMP-binding protein